MRVQAATSAVAVLVCVLAACADESDRGVSEPTSTARGVSSGESATVLPATSDPTSEGAPQSSSTTVSITAAPTVPASTVGVVSSAVSDEESRWVDGVIEAFTAYDTTREQLRVRASEELSGAGELSEQEFFDVTAIRFEGWAEAGGRLVEALPPTTPAPMAPTLRLALEAHLELLAGLRTSAESLRAGEAGPANALIEPAMSAFEFACAEFQFVVLDRTSRLVPCGIDAEDPEVREFVDGPTVDRGDRFVEMPAGSYELTYLGRAGEQPSVMVALDYETDLLIRSSIEVVELAVGDDGPFLRVHTNEYVANPTALAPTEVGDFWPISDHPGPWIGALGDVVVTSSGTGRFGSADAMYWDLVSERERPVAVLGDGEGWLPDTILEPGVPIRLWSLLVDERVLIVTEHPAGGGEAGIAGTDSELLRGGLALSVL